MKKEQIEPQLAQKLDTPLKRILQEFQCPVSDNYRLRVLLLDAEDRKKRSDTSADKWSPDSGRIEIRFEPIKARKRVPVIRMNNYPYRKITDMWDSGMTARQISDALQLYATPGSKNKYARVGNILTKLRIGKKVGDEFIKLRRGNRRTTAKSDRTEKRIENIANANIYAEPTEPQLLKSLVVALDIAESKPEWKFVSLKKFRDEILPDFPVAPDVFKPTDAHWQGAIRSAIEKRLILVGKVPNPKSPQFPVTSIRLNRLMPEVQQALGVEKKDLGFHPIHIKGEPLSATILRERR